MILYSKTTQERQMPRLSGKEKGMTDRQTEIETGTDRVRD